MLGFSGGGSLETILGTQLQGFCFYFLPQRIPLSKKEATFFKKSFKLKLCMSIHWSINVPSLPLGLQLVLLFILYERNSAKPYFSKRKRRVWYFIKIKVNYQIKVKAHKKISQNSTPIQMSWQNCFPFCKYFLIFSTKKILNLFLVSRFMSLTLSHKSFYIER